MQSSAEPFRYRRLWGCSRNPKEAITASFKAGKRLRSDSRESGSSIANLADQRNCINVRNQPRNHSIVWNNAKAYSHHRVDGKRHLRCSRRTDSRTAEGARLAADRPCRRDRDSRELRFRVGDGEKRGLFANFADFGSGVWKIRCRAAEGRRLSKARGPRVT